MCYVSRQVDAYCDQLGRDDALDEAATALVPELVSDYRDDLPRCAEALGVIVTSLPDAEWRELTATLLTDHAQFGHRLAQLLDAELTRAAQEAAPDEVLRRARDDDSGDLPW